MRKPMALTLGENWARELWASDYRIRFKLHGGGEYLTMFTSAYDRARELARAALGAAELIGVIAAWPNPSLELNADGTGRDGFEIIREMGVPNDIFEAAWSGPFYPGDEDEEPWQHRAVKLTWDQADILLWNNIGSEIGVRPTAPLLSKLVNVQRGISVYAYDDRGMDITALSAADIVPLYRRYERWLLDSDRPRMAKIFDPQQV
jgi:Domain of unknown function (DUF3885)